MNNYDYQSDLGEIPNEPGVYRYFNEKNQIIYVGKAKNLRSRVSSYFVKSNQHSRKTRQLVSQIRRIEFTIVHTEWEALLLENQLIKNYQPRFNILLRDDKTYPFICIPNERFPRIFSTRKVEKSYGTYYGPFASVRTMNSLLDLLRSLFFVRTCNLTLSSENVKARKFKVCLEFHIGRCKGPCEELVSAEDYNSDIDQIHHILKGNLAVPQQYLKQKMVAAAEAMKFEEAHQWKTRLDMLGDYQSKTAVVNPKIGDLDVLAILADEAAAYLNYMKIKNGNVVAVEAVEIRKKLDESDEDLFLMVLVEMRQRYGQEAHEVIANILPTTDLDIAISVPQIGDKKKVLQLALKNLMFYRREKQEKMAVEATSASNRQDRVLIKLKTDLQLKALPKHIECFDNSNIQGTNPVASMVCFKNGKPSKKDYRHFMIKTVIGPNDFASMHEIVTRRYTRLLAEKLPLPDLIIIDGGKGQLSAAIDALKSLGIYGEIPVIGIAKRLEEIYFPEDTLPLYIDKKSESLRLIQRIRDEAHRFAITFHRDRRSKTSLISELETVEGIGKKTAEKLLRHFKSVKTLRASAEDEVAKIAGADRAKKLKEYFENLAG